MRHHLPGKRRRTACLSVQYQAGHPGEQDQQDGIHLLVGGQKDRSENYPAFIIDEVVPVDQHQGGSRDQSDHCRLEDRQRGAHPWIVVQPGEKGADNRHDDQRGDADCQCTDSRSEDALKGAKPHLGDGSITDIGGRIEGDGARSGLGDGDNVCKVGHRDPVMGLHHLMLNEG